MSHGRRFFSRRAEDPGESWVEALLDPLRREEVACSVAPSVMARIAAARVPARPLPALLARPRLLWAACVPASLAALGFLSLIGLSLSRGGGAAATPRGLVGEFLWRLIALTAGRVAAAGGLLARVAAPFLRVAWVLIETVAPVLRGAGLVAAATGLLSMVISVYVFSTYRRTAPRAGAASGFFPHGGIR